jgi:hypothetical protein
MPASVISPQGQDDQNATATDVGATTLSVSRRCTTDPPSRMGRDGAPPGALRVADMRQITISTHHDTHHPVAAAFWILAGIIVVIAFGEALTLLAVAFATVTMLGWIYREVEHRVDRNDAQIPTSSSGRVDRAMLGEDGSRQPPPARRRAAPRALVRRPARPG